MPTDTPAKLLAALALGLIINPAWAGSDDTYRADRRQSQQMDRIEQGVREGRITKREADELMAQQRNIADYEERAKDDGRVTARERLELQVKQNKANRRIANEANDGQHR